MSFEHPLDAFQKQHRENRKPQKVEVTNDAFPATREEKEELLQKVQAFKKRIDSIRGTEEERIMQYHLAINEARKDGATLQYVRDNLDELFGKEKEKVIDVPPEQISSTVEDSEKPD